MFWTNKICCKRTSWIQSNCCYSNLPWPSSLIILVAPSAGLNIVYFQLKNTIHRRPWVFWRLFFKISIFKKTIHYIFIFKYAIHRRRGDRFSEMDSTNTEILFWRKRWPAALFNINNSNSLRENKWPLLCSETSNASAPISSGLKS